MQMKNSKKNVEKLNLHCFHWSVQFYWGKF
jgi:hypothetical protein